VKNDRPTFGPLHVSKSAEWQSEVSSGLIQEDDWIRQETEKYSRLLRELKQTNWYVAWSQKHAVDHCLLGDAHGVVCKEERILDPESTRLTDEELRSGGFSTMEQILVQQSQQQRRSNTFTEDKSYARRLVVRPSPPMRKRELSFIYCKANPELTPSPEAARNSEWRTPDKEVSSIGKTDIKDNHAQVIFYDPNKTK
jgi:hypothetical protein